MSEGRTTRSKAAAATTTPVESVQPAVRSTRKAKNQSTTEETAMENFDAGQLEADFENQFVTNIQTEDNGSSNCVYEEQYESEKQSISDEQVTQEAFMADFAEENANSLPSGCDDSSIEKTLITTNNDNGKTHDSMDTDFPMANDDKSLSNAEDTYAQSEELKAGFDNVATDLDAENISEDELPAIPSKPKVQDAEEVSDEELPGPKLAELPADTEVVSEEELPSATNFKKDGKRKLEDYDPSNPTDETDTPDKKMKKTDSNEKKYTLPDLEKYWKAVKADENDFNAWTYLLQYVDSENDVEAAREAYDKFLSRYCYCYGYWRKYADYEKKKGTIEKCNEVFERGLKAIPLSIDLWIHYLTYVKQRYQDDRDYIRSQFERAIDACGLEFRSDKLWEGYIKWEMEDKNFLNIVKIYDRLLATPTQGYKNHMDNFREFVNNNPVQKLISVEEFKKYREEVRKDSNERTDDEIPPGEDEADDHIRNEEEGDAIRKIIINKRKKINKVTVEMINKRWTFEEGIKRPYFHVKQLEKIQLKNWKEYLDFEIEQGDKKRIVILFERCLIACALYEEFWTKFIRYLESCKDDSDYETRTRDIFERACLIHHPDKPSLHIMWSAFEESFGNVDQAVKILQNLEEKHPNLLQVGYRHINLERRRGNYEKCESLYESYLNNSKNKNIASSIAIKYARFLNKLCHNFEKAMNILKTSLEKDPTNTRLALQIIDLALQRENVNEEEICSVLDKFIQQESLDIDQKLLFVQRKVEFLEDFGTSIKDLQEAQKVLQATLEKSKENKKKLSEYEATSSKKSKETSLSANPPASYSNATSYSGYQGYSNSNYPTTNQWSGTAYDYNQYSGSYYNQSSYGNYQHGSYSSY